MWASWMFPPAAILGWGDVHHCARDAGLRRGGLSGGLMLGQQRWARHAWRAFLCASGGAYHLLLFRPAAVVVKEVCLWFALLEPGDLSVHFAD